MALVHAEGAEVWEMTSGAATMLGPDAVVIALAPEGPRAIGRRGPAAPRRRLGRPDDRGRAGAARRDVDACCPLPADASEDHAPLSAVPPVALLAFALARLRGHNPDRPDWIERYHSQGLRHILGTDVTAGEEAVR